MKSIIIFTIFIISSIFAQDFVLLPPLPPNYQTNIQVNVVNIFRGKDEPIFNPEGKSLALFEAVSTDTNVTKAILTYHAGL